jgi:HK97 family phage major capsid protein
MPTLIPIIALRQRKVDLTKSAAAIMSLGNLENRDLSAAESKNFDKTQGAIADVERQIIAAERELAEESGMPMSADENSAFGALANGQVPTQDPRAPKRMTLGNIGIKSYQQLFGPPRSSAFSSAQEFVRAVRVSGQSFDPRLQAGMTDSNPTSAGFLVPETWAQEILNYALESSLILPRARVFPLSQGNTLKVPAVKDDDHSAGFLWTGINEQWSNELQTITETDMSTRLLELSANKLALLSNASSELVEDSAQFENILTANLQAAASFFLDSNFLLGSGVARPLGMLNAANPSLVVASKNAATPSGGFLWEDAVSMFTAMTPACRGRAVWIFGNDLLPALSVMQIVVRNIAGTENVGGSATPQFTLNADGTGTLLGRPVLFSEKLKTKGTQADCCFVCPDQYAILLRREFQLRRSLDAGFTNDSIWWRLTCRVDGQPLWANTQKLKNSQVTSPFVVLQAR